MAIVGIAVSASSPPPIPTIPLAAGPLYARGTRQADLVAGLSVGSRPSARSTSTAPTSSSDNTYAATTEYVGCFDAELLLL